jgi:ribosomal-protein-serine acetyltransferase
MCRSLGACMHAPADPRMRGSVHAAGTIRGVVLLPEHLEGHGVTLRRWRPGDEELLHQAVVQSTEHLRPWMEWISQEPQTVQQRRLMLIRWEQDWLGGGDVAYGVFVDGAMAGGCGLHRRRGPRALEIGYWLHPSFLGRGIMTAAARLLTDAAFTVAGVERVEIHHDKANAASRGIPQRLGYELEGERPDPRQAPGEIGIDCTWVITRSAWLAAAGPPGQRSRSSR